MGNVQWIQLSRQNSTVRQMLSVAVAVSAAAAPAASIFSQWTHLTKTK